MAVWVEIVNIYLVFAPTVLLSRFVAFNLKLKANMSTPTKETKKRLHKDVDRNEREKNLSMTEMDEENEKMMNFVK